MESLGVPPRDNPLEASGRWAAPPLTWGALPCPVPRQN